MAAEQTLSDEQLLAVVKSGDSSLMRALTPEERQRVVGFSHVEPYQPRNLRAEAARAAATNGQPEGTPPSWLDEHLNPALESLAHPQSLGDIASLLIPDAPGLAAGAQIAMRGIRNQIRPVAAAVSATAKSLPWGIGTSVKAAGEGVDAYRAARGAQAAKPAIAAVKAAPVEVKAAETLPQTVSGGTPPPADLPPAAVPAELPTARELRARGGDTVNLPGKDRTPGQLSPTWVRSDLGMAAKRAKVTLTAEDYDAGAALVKKGASPAEAVQQLKGAEAPAAAKPVISQAEANAYRDLRAAGKTDEEATAAIEAMRKLQQIPGVETPRQAGARIAERERTGKWRGSPNGKQIRAKAEPPD